MGRSLRGLLMGWLTLGNGEDDNLRLMLADLCSLVVGFCVRYVYACMRTSMRASPHFCVRVFAYLYILDIHAYS
jgi:hypothetical protein